MNKTDIYNALMEEFKNPIGVCALMGNLKAESNFNSMNLQNTLNKKLNMTDEEYTQSVDNGTYTAIQFCSDSAGYGIAQWTSSGRKKLLLVYAKISNCSIGNLDMQIAFLIWEMKSSYMTCYNAVKNAKTIRECSDIILKNFERPKDQSENACIYRAKLGTALYNELVQEREEIKQSVLPLLKRGMINDCVSIAQGLLKAKGYYSGKVDMKFGTKTFSAVENFQKDNDITIDGIIGSDTWCKLGVNE